MSDNLALDQMAGSQNNKYITHNDSNGQLDAAITEALDVTISTTSPVTISNSNFRRNQTFRLTDGSPVPAANFTVRVGAIKRGLFTVVNNTSYTATIEIASQPVTSPTVAAGATAVFSNDGVNVRAAAGGGGGSLSAASTTETLTGTSTTKAVTPDSLAALWEKGSDIASASTISIGEGGYFIVTGTTTITDIDFATPKDGRAAILSFSGALTLTHNATTLILPGGANITTAAGDCCLVVQENSDNVRVVWYQNANGQPITGGASGTAGKQSLWIPASAMTARTTNGAASGSTETSTNKIMISTLNFDATTQEFAQFQVRMPKSWNEGTVTFQPVWSHASTATNFGVVWALEGVAFSDDDALDAAFGTAQTSTDTGGTTDDAYIGPESSAITIGGTPAAQDYVVFQVKRNPSDGSDTLAIDARLHGITLFYTTDAENDA